MQQQSYCGGAGGGLEPPQLPSSDAPIKFAAPFQNTSTINTSGSLLLTFLKCYLEIMKVRVMIVFETWFLISKKH